MVGRKYMVSHGSHVTPGRQRLTEALCRARESRGCPVESHVCLPLEILPESWTLMDSEGDLYRNHRQKDSQVPILVETHSFGHSASVQIQGGGDLAYPHSSEL